MNNVEITLKTRVIISKDAQGRWFARGLDIDYAAQGRSTLEVQKAFEAGFLDTVHAHAEEYGHLDYFTKPAPTHVVEKYIQIAEELAADEVILSLKGLMKYNVAELYFYEADQVDRAA